MAVCQWTQIYAQSFLVVARHMGGALRCGRFTMTRRDSIQLRPDSPWLHANSTIRSHGLCRTNAALLCSQDYVRESRGYPTPWFADSSARSFQGGPGSGCRRGPHFGLWTSRFFRNIRMYRPRGAMRPYRGNF